MVTSVRVCDPKCLMPVPTPVSAYSNLCCPHSDGHVSVSRQRIFVHQSSWRQYPEKPGQTCFEQNPDRQASETADSLISKHPDRVSTADRIETKHRTAFFRKSGQNPDSCENRDRQNPDGETSNRKSGHLVTRIYCVIWSISYGTGIYSILDQVLVLTGFGVLPFPVFMHLRNLNHSIVEEQDLSGGARFKLRCID